MIKKVICLLFTVSLLAILTACGDAASSTAEVTDNTTAVEAPTEVVNTEETLKEETPKVEEVVEEPEENKEEPEEFTLTVEYATDKLQKMADAYNALYDSKDEAEELAVRLLYYRDTEPITDGDFQTKDGYSLQNISVDYDRDYYTMKGIILGALWDYYYDHVNNDSTKDYPSYISESNKDDLADILLRIIDDSEKNGGIDTNDFYMYNVTYIPAIISHDGNTVTIENVTEDVTVEHKDIVMSDLSTATVASQADIYIDGKDSGLKLVFDKDGNLLNLNDENATIEVVIPFE